jgi:hypothetical protein
MDREESGSIEGLDDADLKNFIDEEEVVEDGVVGRSYLETVEEQNDHLMAGQLKEFLQSCRSRKARVDFNVSKEFFQKEVQNKAQLPQDLAEIVAMDSQELTSLIASLKNAVAGMRVKVAKIIDVVSQCSSDPQESISLINLRVEVLCEYWSYLSLFALKKVTSFNQA